MKARNLRLLFMVWLRRPDNDISDDESESDVSESEYFGKDYFLIFAGAGFGETCSCFSLAAGLPRYLDLFT
jgi:hypothetical protein